MPNKAILDDIKKIKDMDSKNMLGSLELLGEQMREIYKLGENLKLPISYEKANKILVVGMGGSETNWHVIKTLFSKEIAVPLEILNDYHIPAWVDKNTLVIGSSYSGSTEETINAVKEAKERGAKLMILTSGGELRKWAKIHKISALIFTEKNNPCGQPRIGSGYMIMGGIMLLNRIGLLEFSGRQARTLIKTVSKYGKKFSAKIAVQTNRAKQIAQKTIDKTVWYAGAEHLAGNAHAGANQMNENGKRFAGYYLIPELNHHLLEGMKHPRSNQHNLLFILLESGLYDGRIQKRFAVTKKVLNKNNIIYARYLCQEKEKINQMGEALALTGFIGYYAAILAGIDPNLVPYVDYFKKQMAQNH